MQIIFDLIQILVAPAAQVLVALMGAYLLTLWLTLIIWTFRDIETRSRSVVTQVFATLLVVFFFLPGALLYLILRPKETLDEAFQRALQEEYLLQDLEELPLCPTCRHYMQGDFVLCPYCHTRLRENCPSCERLVELRWSVCPFCATGLPSPGDEEVDAEAEPAAPARLPEWVSPALQGLRTRVLRRRAREAGVPLAAERPRPSFLMEAPLVTPEIEAGPSSNGHHDEVEPEVVTPMRGPGRRRRRELPTPVEPTVGSDGVGGLPANDSTPAEGMVASKK